MIYLSRILSTYLIKCAKLDYEEANAAICAPGAKEIIKNLIESESAFFSPDTIVIGVDMNCESMSSSIQSALDVKAVTVGSLTNNADRVIPEIKQNIIYYHKSLVWVRVIIPHNYDISNLQNLSFHPSVVALSDDVFELYVSKSSRYCNPIYMIKELDRLGFEVIFCSENPIFRNNPQLFISNHVKFMFCYEQSSIKFSILTPKDVVKVNLHMMYSLLFLQTKNLTILPKPFSQFSKMSAERPKSQIDSTPFTLAGPRDGIFLDRPSFHGGRGLNTSINCNLNIDFTENFNKL